jgi:hypothetical protein
LVRNADGAGEIVVMRVVCMTVAGFDTVSTAGETFVETRVVRPAARYP